MDKTAETSDRTSAREAILGAFRDIVLTTGYEKMRVLDVVARSGVARSTFYEHFESREDVLRESVRSRLDDIAALVDPACDLRRTGDTLKHMAENRALTKSLFASPGTDVIVEVLADLIEGRALIPAVRARAIAGAQIAVISSWLDGHAPTQAADVVRVLRETAFALISQPRL